MKKLMKPLAAAIAMSAFALPALADHKLELTAGGGRYYFDSKSELKNDNFRGLALGYVINDKVTAEGWWTRSDTKVDVPNTNIGVKAQEFRLDGLYHFANNGNVTPFLVAGLGRIKYEAPTIGFQDEETRLNLGAGIKTQLGDRFNFRADARLYEGLASEQTDFGILLALTYQFGDSGHINSAPAVVAPAPVVAEPIDSDGDGVMDGDDQCPDTAANLKVDNVGCPLTLLETVAIDLEVNFDNNSSIVNEEYRAEIKRVADFMGQYQDTVVEIQGHTNDRGEASYNQWLSERRAGSVAKVLVEDLGIAAERVTAKGYGETQPKVANDSAANRAANRRVVAEVSTEVKKLEER